MFEKIMQLLGYKNIYKIKIPTDYEMPKVEKMRCKMNFYIATGKFQDKIIINKENELLDGYITYLLYKWLSRKYIKVTVIDCKKQVYKTAYKVYRRNKFVSGIDIGNEKDKTVIIKNYNLKGAKDDNSKSR